VVVLVPRREATPPVTAPALVPVAAESTPADVVPSDEVPAGESPAAEDAAPEDPAAPKPAHPRPAPQRPGRILVRANPWADVLVDGTAIGVTPLSPISLKPGRHTVTLSNSDLKRTRTLTVEVRSGRDSKVEVDFQR
jgi:hypothetical protein